MIGSMEKTPVLKTALLLGLVLLHSIEPVSARTDACTVARVEVRTKYACPPPEDYAPLIPLEEGDEMTDQRIATLRKTLEGSGLFRSVSIQLSEDAKGTSVLFDLHQLERVRRIRMKGNWLVLSSSVYRILAMQEGDPFEEEELSREAERIKDLYEEKGWYETEVTADFEQDPEDGSVRIDYRMKRGHHIRFDPIELEGVRAGDPERIRTILRIWPWVTANRLQNKLEKVRAYYAKQGYPTAQVRVEALEIDEERRKRALLRLAVDEGKRLVAKVEGNEALPDKEILAATTFFRNRSVGFFDAEDSAEAIRKRYEKKGFPDARVEFDRQETDTEVRVTFSVVEGSKAYIGEIAFLGNEALSEETLFERILTRPRKLSPLRRGRFLTEKWNEDLAAIENLYLAKGFRDAAIEHALEPIPGKDRRVLLEVRIQEGPRYTIASSTVRGVDPERETALAKETLLTPGDPFHAGKLAREARRIRGFYAERGHLLVLVEYDFRARDDHTVEIDFDVQEGPRFLLSGLIVTGNRKTRDKTIRKTLRVREGDPIDNEQLSATRQRLFQLGVFEGLSLKVPGLHSAGEALEEHGREEADRPVLIEVREKRSLGLEVGISYDSDWGLEGLLSAREENLLGRAKKVTVDVIGGEERTEARLAYADPTLMGMRATLTAQAKYERAVREAFTEQNISFEGGVFRRLRESYTPGIFLVLDNSVVFDVQSSAPDAPEPADSTNLFVRPQIVRDTRRDKLYPRNGSNGQARVAVSNQAWASDDDLVLYQLQLQDYYEISTDWIVAGRLSLDHVDPYGSTSTVPSTYLLFAGGNNSVRGFPKDGLGPRDLSGSPRGATTKILGNLEIRFPIYRLVHGVAFVDVGSLTDGFGRIGLDTFRWSAGTGLRLHTPVGPIRLEYGYQLQDNPPLDRGELHFSLGFPF